MLTEAVLEFAAATTQSSLLPSLIKVKAIARQYHSWFDWDKNNINKFVSLFGDDFRAFMANRIKAQELEKAVTDFMTIGRDRNRLVHENFAAGYLEATTEEIYSTYQSALRLVNDIPQALHACSAFLVGAKEESTDI
jgi:hypothetical protein